MLNLRENNTDNNINTYDRILSELEEIKKYEGNSSVLYVLYQMLRVKELSNQDFNSLKSYFSEDDNIKPSEEILMERDELLSMLNDKEWIGYLNASEDESEIVLTEAIDYADLLLEKYSENLYEEINNVEDNIDYDEDLKEWWDFDDEEEEPLKETYINDRGDTITDLLDYSKGSDFNAPEGYTYYGEPIDKVSIRSIEDEDTVCNSLNIYYSNGDWDVIYGYDVVHLLTDLNAFPEGFDISNYR